MLRLILGHLLLESCHLFQMVYRNAWSIRFNSDRFNSRTDVVLSLQHGLLLHTLDGRCATNKYFQIIGSIHDIESYFGIDNTAGSYVQILFCHWGHKAIIFIINQ